jgi:hypothetical protein
LLFLNFVASWWELVLMGLKTVLSRFVGRVSCEEASTGFQNYSVCISFKHIKDEREEYPLEINRHNPGDRCFWNYWSYWREMPFVNPNRSLRFQILWINPTSIFPWNEPPWK